MSLSFDLFDKVPGDENGCADLGDKRPVIWSKKDATCVDASGSKSCRRTCQKIDIDLIHGMALCTSDQLYNIKDKKCTSAPGTLKEINANIIAKKTALDSATTANDTAIAAKTAVAADATADIKTAADALVTKTAADFATATANYKAATGDTFMNFTEDRTVKIIACFVIFFILVQKRKFLKKFFKKIL